MKGYYFQKSSKNQKPKGSKWIGTNQLEDKIKKIYNNNN